MIRDAEIRRLAGQAGVEPRIVELDYALGWALRGLAGHPYLVEEAVREAFAEAREESGIDFGARDPRLRGAPCVSDVLRLTVRILQLRRFLIPYRLG